MKRPLIKLACFSISFFIIVSSSNALPEWMEYPNKNPSGYKFFKYPNDPVLVEKEEKLRLKVLELAKKDNQIDKYPEQSALLSLGCFYFDELRYTEALKYFEKAEEIAKKSLDVLWTKKVNIKDRVNYLPSYSNPDDELKGKYQSLVVLKSWVVETLYKQGKKIESAKVLDATFELMAEKKVEQIIVQIKLFKLKSNLLRDDGKISEADTFAKKAEELESTLDHLDSRKK